MTTDVTRPRGNGAAAQPGDREESDFFENSCVPMHWVGADGAILRANQAELDLLGYRRDEYVGRHIADFHVDEHVIDDMLARLARGETLRNHPSQMRCKDGSIRHVVVSSNVLFEGGDFLHTRCVTMDVTEQVRAEGARRESESRLRAMVEALPAAVYVTDAEGRLTHFNHAAVELAGRVPELGSDTWCVTWRLFHLDGTPLPHEECPMALALKGEPYEAGAELIAEKPNGERAYIAPYPSPLRDSAGRIVGGINMLIDVTERKLADERLRYSEERYRRLVELLPAAIYMCEASSGTVTYYNEQAAELWGRAPRLGDTNERFCGSVRLYLPDGTELPHDTCPMALALREGRTFRNEEVVIERPDGTRVSALVNIGPIRDASGHITGAINVFSDISALRRSEQSLREQKENLQTLLDTLPVAVFIAHDPDCARITGNGAAAQLLRMPVGANLSKTAASPDAPPSHFEVVADGQVVPPEALPLQRAARGEIVAAEEAEHVFDDGTRRSILIAAKPLYDAEGRPRGAIASMLDITDRKLAEVELKEADRRKDEFLATLSHELRNPLAPIKSAMSLLGKARGDPARFPRIKEILERQVSHLVRLIDDLLDVSRISRGKVPLRKERVDLVSVVHHALETIRPMAQNHELEIAVPEQPILLDADAVRLAQVVNNLLNNACKYTAAGGRIRLAVERHDETATVSVKDSGIGLSPDELDAIFEMFSQAGAARSSGGGLGIGLSLAKRLAELHGGTIEVRSEGAGCGSEFIVRLPVATGAAVEGPGDGEPLPVAAPSESRRILVVDDNVDAATMLATTLEMEGHDAQVAHDGREALEQAEAFRPAVVFLDIGLPGMDGYDVCRAIRQKPWGKKAVVVALTGWGQEDDRRRSAEADFDAHLVKPVDRTTLARSIAAHPAERRMLEPRDAG